MPQMAVLGPIGETGLGAGGHDSCDINLTSIRNGDQVLPCSHYLIYRINLKDRDSKAGFPMHRHTARQHDSETLSRVQQDR